MTYLRRDECSGVESPPITRVTPKICPSRCFFLGTLQVPRLLLLAVLRISFISSLGKMFHWNCLQSLACDRQQDNPWQSRGWFAFGAPWRSCSRWVSCLASAAVWWAYLPKLLPAHCSLIALIAGKTAGITYSLWWPGCFRLSALCLCLFRFFVRWAHWRCVGGCPLSLSGWAPSWNVPNSHVQKAVKEVLEFSYM